MQPFAPYRSVHCVWFQFQCCYDPDCLPKEQGYLGELMWWLIAGVIIVVVLFVLTRSWKSYGDYLIDDFGLRISTIAKENIPLARRLHWEEITILFQLASYLRPEGRVFPERRPIDMRLSMCAFASLEAMIVQLAGKTPDYGSRSHEERQQAIIKAHAPLLGVIAIQKTLMQDRQLPRDDYTIGYLHGLSDAFGQHHGLDLIQRIALVVTTMRMFYGMNSAVEYYSSIWNGDERSPRARASRSGKQEAIAFLDSGKPPLGLCGPRSDTVAAEPIPKGAVGIQRPSSVIKRSTVSDATKECRKIVWQQVPQRAKPRLDTTFVRGYLLGISDGVCQTLGLGDVESIAVATGLFCTYFGAAEGTKLMESAMQVGERSISHKARLLGGQEAIDHHNSGRSPRGLRDHFESRKSKKK